MLARTGLDPQEALVCTMVLVAAADGGMTDREIGVMAGQVQTLPIFQDFSTEQLESATDAAVGLLERGGGAEPRRPADPRGAGTPPARDRLRAGLRGGRRRPRCRASNPCRCSSS